MTRGPVPNREADLARPRSRKGSGQMPVTKGQSLPPTIPEADPTWHPIAEMVWNSLATSGQAAFYQSSDWAFAYSLCDDLTEYKQACWKDGTAKRSPEMLKALLSAMSNLLMTEADRRRVRIELQEPAPESDPAAVLAIADYRQELGLDDEPDNED